ncbi:MAG TPA: hypothetical protein VM691_06800 [Myxococcales bacterium]|nr:hypothetical protein [Myxococcales bacterium]
MVGRTAPDWFPPRPSTYAYALGLYLGDGCLYVPARGSPLLQIRLDRSHPELITEARRAIACLLPVSSRVHVYEDRRCFSSCVQASYQHWLEVFPQHGAGRKHNRPIVLRPWQVVMLERAPQAFLRGLIHSDGCRTVNRFKTKLPSGRTAEYAYPRYFFSNRSADIRGLFCEYCERLGIRWTQSNPRNISVSHRRSVALLDSFVGPKR